MKNNLIVKEPEELILMKGSQFSESALKLSAYLIANLKKNQNIYEINVKEYLEKFDKKKGNYDYIHNIAKELSKKQFEIEDRFKKKFAIYNFVSAVEYENGLLQIEFSTMLMEYLLKIKDKYLRYEIQNIMCLNSKYSIRLYKILKDNLERNLRYGKNAELKLSVDEIREILEISKSYQYSSHIKARILEKAKKDISEKTDIIFDYEEIKTGRKVTHIKFLIKLKPIEFEKKYNTKIEKYFKSRAMFVKLLRENYKGNGKFFGTKIIERENYWLGIDKKGLMYATSINGDLIRNLNNIESGKIYDLWFKIAQNSNLYQDLIINGVCLKELYQDNKELYLEFVQELNLLREEGII